MKKFEEIDHTSDLAIRVFGKNLNELFCSSFYALHQLQGLSRKVSRPDTTETIVLNHRNEEILLIDFLNEIIYFQEKYRSFGKLLDLKINKNSSFLKCEARIAFSQNSIQNHEFREIKAVTYGGAEIKRCKDQIFIDLILDV